MSDERKSAGRVSAPENSLKKVTFRVDFFAAEWYITDVFAQCKLKVTRDHVMKSKGTEILWHYTSIQNAVRILTAVNIPPHRPFCK